VPDTGRKLSHRLIEWIGPWIIRLIGATLRYERIHSGPLDDLIRHRKPYLFSVWHGRLFLPVYHHRDQGLVAMVSQHADGEVIANIVHRMGYGTVRGSSTRGGKKAFLQLLKHLKGGGWGAMIPDGPTGPRFVLKAGTVQLASGAGCPLVPITFAARSCWRLRTWDRMVLPKPFSRAVLLYGDPLLLPPDLDEAGQEAWRRQVETVMNNLLRDAERRVGGPDPFVPEAAPVS